MLLGNIDELKSSGYLEGWACDTTTPATPSLISIRDCNGTEIGWGLAHLYRKDLVDAGIGTGWCGFRVRSAVSLKRLRSHALDLVERQSNQLIRQLDRVPLCEDSDPQVSDPATLRWLDPTVVRDVADLRGCEALFAGFIKSRGVNAFVRVAYLYILGRPADDHGLTLYGGMLRRAALTACDLLATLAVSDEFTAAPRTLAAPNTPSFPFHRP